MEMLLVSDRGKKHQNYIKLIDSVVSGLLNRGVKVSLLIGDDYDGKFENRIEIVRTHHFNLYSTSYDERRYIEVFDVATEIKPDLIVLIDTPDPQRLYLAMEYDVRAKQFKYAIYPSLGLGHFIFKPLSGHFFNKLLDMDSFVLAFIGSNNPKLDDEFYRQEKNCSEKVKFIHDITHLNILGESDRYLEIDKASVRKKMGISEQSKVFLYFGTYYYLKGADLLLEASQKFIDYSDITFIFAGDMNQTSYDLKLESYNLDNSIIHDRYIDKEEIYNYFAAADIVVLPYRSGYNRFSSAMFALAPVSHTPLLISDISPHKESVEQYNLGHTFECGSVEDLVVKIKYILNNENTDNKFGFEEYINDFGTIDELSELLIDSIP
ncbi:MAG: glycosyltransferase [Candidatus Marinimicrobia bacterium]|jgi:glycosyltransferase involved in cell wall biosynthesis|nr:glycosyltransferase [Candidatus Neomarinimicrobiota bacterium]